MAARIQPNKNPSDKAKEQLAVVKQKLGKTPNIFATLAHSPAALGYFLAGGAALNETKISAVLREQIALTVAGVNTCNYCASAHTAAGKAYKIEAEELAQNLLGKSSDAKIQAALTFARQVVTARGYVSDADLRAVRSAGYSDEEIVEIVAVICQNIFTNYFNHIAGTEVDFPEVNATFATQASY